ncbi:NAD-dependent epimerase/dehydratase family protein [Jiella sp. MQZ9-1]|uniref:NAD-dependent epimerase/dehydratase family protein n=1 Tax=Jiella flava TaxID=2816857 RepID=A0A939FXD3_9HYPH|nr:NAD-dependent epimerase/dehydratase family protein [Jiella flava]MBO0662619.1 NAD-dependent epimerase/dehydratase family protein [Jiella flava]MCD2471041.1 NAD-dependent epimerase/dehydratase family protein [Jiella flava]
MAGERILLTGASGFIAKHIALQLLQAGYRVRGTVRSPQKGEALRQTLARAGADVARLEIAEADLLRDEGWEAAARGCDVVCHTASPFPARQSKDKWALVPVAKGGTLRVVDAAIKAKVQRFVMTSSVVAVYYGHGADHPPVYGEDDWSNVGAADISDYAVSKTEAEAAAWGAADAASLPMVTINPSFVAGPLLDADAGTSATLIGMMMTGKLPAVPNVSFGIVDVRDVAKAHVAALTAAEAPGRRFIVSAGSLTMIEIGQAVAAAVPECRKRVPRFTVPDFVVRLAAKVVPEARAAVPELGRQKTLLTKPAETILGFTPGHTREAVAETALSLRDHGWLRRDPQIG